MCPNTEQAPRNPFYNLAGISSTSAARMLVHKVEIIYMKMKLLIINCTLCVWGSSLLSGATGLTDPVMLSNFRHLKAFSAGKTFPHTLMLLSVLQCLAASGALIDKSPSYREQTIGDPAHCLARVYINAPLFGFKVPAQIGIMSVQFASGGDESHGLTFTLLPKANIVVAEYSHGKRPSSTVGSASAFILFGILFAQGIVSLSNMRPTT